MINFGKSGGSGSDGGGSGSGWKIDASTSLLLNHLIHFCKKVIYRNWLTFSLIKKIHSKFEKLIIRK